MKKLRHAFLVLGMVILSGAIALTGCKDTLRKGTYTWVAGGEGGGWYTVVSEFARLLGEKEPMITIKVVPGGGIQNPVLVDQGDADIAWGAGFVNRAAYNGVAPLYQKKYTNIASIAGTLSVDYYHFLAAKDQEITTIEQLAEKIKNGEKIKLAAALSGTTDYVMASIIMGFYDVSFDMIERSGGNFAQLGYADIAKMFIDGDVDYAIVNLGKPGAIITEMASARPSVILGASNAVIDYCHYTWGTVARGSGLDRIPGGMYSGIDDDVATVCQSTEIIVNLKLSDAVVYTITKVLNENKDFMLQFGMDYNAFDPQGATASSVQVPLHPGAAKYYREIGMIQ